MTPARAIRIAMMLGVLMFGGVAWFITRAPDWKAPEPGLLDQLSLIARFGWIAVALALVFMFLKFRDSTNSSRTSTVSILAWTLGETLALTFVAFPPPVNR